MDRCAVLFIIFRSVALDLTIHVYKKPLISCEISGFFIVGVGMPS